MTIEYERGPSPTSTSCTAPSAVTPPPVPLPPSGAPHARSTAARSSVRKRGSPSLAKISVTVRPAATSTRPSMSMNGQARSRASRRPTSVLPVAMNPVSTTCTTSEAPDLFEIPLEVATDLEERVATELLEEELGHDERHDRFRDDGGRRNRHDVGPLDRGGGLVLGRDIDRMERAHEGRQRLEGRPDHEGRAARHTPFGAPGVVGSPFEAGPLVEVDLVVHGRSAPSCALEAEADLDPLGGLHAHERVREPAVELAVPLGVAPEPGGQTHDERLDHAAQRIPLGLALVDECDDATFGLRVGHANHRLLGARGDLLGR